ncbi:MAG: biotin synthase BioB [Epsilonproteobacteria bacterium]|nr:MAG: biotin synthase BioB [Campylobacterota bacterium]RLA66057.1 MAG: biotin synthase BioB [Campylobacterota bacterium]
MRNDWNLKEINEIYHLPLLELIYQAATVHRKNFNAHKIQVSRLISIKTGGCPEDCNYCPQAARYQTDIEKNALMNVDEVISIAKEAKATGSSRVCLGAAWREVKDNSDFDQVLEMVKEVTSMDMEVCCTLGMLSESQAKKLKDAGLYAYNHNIDTSEDNYKKIITTRSYDDRMNTLSNVKKAKISVCCGGIIGLGETEEDRFKMLQSLSSMNPHPASVPINTLVAVKGTPLEQQKPVPIWDLVKMIATARILMPKSVIRLSAGREGRSMSDQALCFMAGANSIFAGNKLLTTPNPSLDHDQVLFETLGLTPTESFENYHGLS